MVKNLLQAYQRLGSQMSLKLHFLHAHLNFFPPNLRAVSDEHREWFYQDIALIESQYKGKSNANMMGAIAGLCREKMIYLIFVVLNVLNCYRYSSSVICKYD